MSSRFVSAGSFAVEAGVAQPAAPATDTTPSKSPPLASSIASSTKSPTVVGEKDTTASSGSKPAPLSSSTPQQSTATTASSSTPFPVPIPAASPPQPKPESQTSAPLNPKTAEWQAVQAQIAQEREARLKAKQAAAAGGGAEEKSLYEVLQANKAAKQAAFEEASKIKNQFRALDDDEIDFLDEVLMKKKAEEQRIRREMEEGLDAFRRAQNQSVGDGEGEEEEEILGVFEGGRKRRRKGNDAGGKRILVKRKTSGEGDGGHNGEEEKGTEKVSSTGSTGKAGETKPAAVGVSKPTAATATTTKTGTSTSSGGGLGGLLGYGSSDEDDD